MPSSLPCPSFPGAARRARTVGMLSSFPPTQCGLATFTAALASGLATHGTNVRVVQVVDRGQPASSGELVIGQLVNGSPTSVSQASELLNRADVAVVQHEYGLYGGTDGDEIVDILGGLTVPSIVVAHTVLSRPSAHQWSVLNDVAALAEQVVVMSDAARIRLCEIFTVDPDKVVTIAHGAAVPPRVAYKTSPRPTLLTWGLIGPGKGIERAIEAMRTLHDHPTRPRYLVAGRTHPKVLAADGESYRDARRQQARLNGTSHAVTFDHDYRDVAALTTLIQSSAVVVLPYDSKEQATSGVLVDAVAAGRPIVATAFPHAVELLSSGAGIVVDHDDPDAMARALRRILNDPDLAARMAAEASRLAPSLGWPVVASEYLAVANRLLAGHPVLV